MRVLGVDGWAEGWVGVELLDGRFAQAFTAERLADLIGLNDYAAVTVDIPLGLLDTSFRDADSASRALLGPRRNSVFSTPSRPVLLEESYDAANALHRQLADKGLSKQSYALRERILEADALYGDASLPLFEIHPELSFTMMGEGPPASKKKIWHGLRDRMNRLESAGIVIPADIGDAAQADPDDVLDAAAAAWSAHRVATGVAGSMPDPPQMNECGRRVAMWF
jgi:predicted RNase H-like nuclease